MSPNAGRDPEASADHGTHTRCREPGQAAAAIFGAGPGLGVSIARFLGHRGHRLALVARNRTRLEALAAGLVEEGIEASCYKADIADIAAFDELFATIVRGFGDLDIAVYQTAGPPPSSGSALRVTAEGLREYVDRLLLAPIHAAGTVLAPMIERGRGTMLFTLGASALGPSPRMSQVGIPLAGLRNHLLALASETERSGVQVRLLTIGGLILGSDIQRTLVPGATPEFPGALDPDELAASLGELLTGESGPELVVGPFVPNPSG
jgi:short-subunit dehydrogenase